MNFGDKVMVAKVPSDLPNDNRLRSLFKGCVGKTFTIAAVDEELFELHVGEAFGEMPDKHRIWLDAAHLKKIEA
jgi:hypothetical protein